MKKSTKSGIPPILASNSRSSGSDRIENRADDERRDELEEEEADALDNDRSQSATGMDSRWTSRSARSASAEGRGLSLRLLGDSGDVGPLYRGMGSGRGVKSEGEGARNRDGEVRDERRDEVS